MSILLINQGKINVGYKVTYSTTSKCSPDPVPGCSRDIRNSN